MNDNQYHTKEKDPVGFKFLNTVSELDRIDIADPVLHVLCLKGGMSFVFQEVYYHVVPSDYVILPNALLASDFKESLEFQGIIMVLSEHQVGTMALNSNYGIIGHLSLLRNPVMQLTEAEMAECKEDLLLLRHREADRQHLFRHEMLSHLLLAHILDLFDIHARRYHAEAVTERHTELLRRFIAMLYRGDYREHRDLDYYASALCITSHYLSEISKKVCEVPATYWIDRSLLLEIVKLLHNKELSLSEISQRLHFSSLAYFSRYVRKHTGMSPSELRKRQE
ncbi:MAG: helix-turn-helix domain-containing protein [Prevotella sp.]|jgi:AraC family transcriptional activator of pobA